MIEIKDNLDNLIITNIDDLKERINHKLESKDIISEEIYLYSQEELDLLTQPEKKQILQVILNNFRFYNVETSGHMTYLTYENSDIELIVKTKLAYSSNWASLSGEKLDSAARFLIYIMVTYVKEKIDPLKKVYNRIIGIDSKDIEARDFQNIDLGQFKDFIHFVSARSYTSYKLTSKTTSYLDISIDDYIIRFNLNDIFIELSNSNYFGFSIILLNIEDIYKSINSVDIIKKKMNNNF